LKSAVVPRRPEGPDADLLASAALSLQRLLALQETPTWSVMRRDDRPRSTIFLLEAEHGAGSTRAYLKAALLPGDATDDPRFERRRSKERGSLVFEDRIAGRLFEVLSSEGVGFDLPLAIDVEGLSAMRLEVPGREIGRAFSRMIPGRRNQARASYEAVGRAIHLAEGQTRLLGPSFEEETLDRRVQAELEQARRGMPESLHRPVAAKASQLRSAIDIETAAVWGHGDLSSTNILVDAGRIGLIDWSWRPSLAGESVAYFIARLGAEPRTPANWKSSLTEAVLRGYGADSEGSWQLAYLLRLLRWANKSSTVLRGWSHRELARVVAPAGR